ncbi:MAG TPA: hypothetical protein VJT80_09655 [Steroidobacteraceae bacterium]|jgi:hypothetical protein|nr:hypothetical protein [Steroidobacteraceae bacterium]
MVAIQRVGSMLLVSLLLAACGSADEPSKPPPPVDETVFRDTVKPMEKARDVENVLQKEKEATDRALDENQ